MKEKEGPCSLSSRNAGGGGNLAFVLQRKATKWKHIKEKGKTKSQYKTWTPGRSEVIGWGRTENSRDPLIPGGNGLRGREENGGTKNCSRLQTLVGS